MSIRWIEISPIQKEIDIPELNVLLPNLRQWDKKKTEGKIIFSLGGHFNEKKKLP